MINFFSLLRCGQPSIDMSSVNECLYFRCSDEATWDILPYLQLQYSVSYSNLSMLFPQAKSFGGLQSGWMAGGIAQEEEGN